MTREELLTKSAETMINTILKKEFIHPYTIEDCKRAISVLHASQQVIDRVFGERMEELRMRMYKLMSSG